ncbi:WXG100 family type VII secretion target [Micromonospora sp. WMMD1128]|uniref:WXG100 family type VII secretion target n=1 Tax=unclassified Micromonospora TaxID=2617518 RepID=UPI00248A9F35|nr:MULTISPECIES: WXG100 family type VII secretion target [unclassified Micromonospora]WBB71948.1 WXG100 family type VII secretion target [Micromonospora sp. WMMD1128]WFE34595.1 WXG100 family type VII secretion target [Micromonospora sp. WMMD975]
MSNYRFDFNQADATLYDMNQINGRISSALDEMERNVERSLQEWTGDARSAYYVAKAEWRNAAGAMTVHLERARQTLLTISDNYGTTEQRHSKIWNDVRGG